MQGGTVPFDTVKAAAGAHAEAFCRRYLPQGKRTGNWWLAPVPWRPDKNPSLIVSLQSGRWQDKARNEFGDLTDLLARLDGCTLAEAATRLASMMGLR